MKVGIDIVKISRFRNKEYGSNQKFYQNIFSKNEINYCLKYKDPYPHFAGRFAAKEAVIKATDVKIRLNQIVINKKKNNLEIKIKNILKPNIVISISHEKEYSVAMSINFTNI